jgi:hypothetical protein
MRLALAFVAPALLLGCPGPAQPDSRGVPPTRQPAGLATVVLDGIPHVRQRPDFCGEACVEMASTWQGHAYSQDAVFAATGLDPALGRGAYTRDLVKAVTALGYAPGRVGTTVDPDRAGTEIDAAFAALHADLARGVPSIVCMHYDDRPNTTEHFRLVVGYDADRDEVVYHEPAEDDGAYRRMRRTAFQALWPLKYEADAWTLIRIPLRATAPVAAAAADPAAAFTPAEYAQHVIALRTKLADLELDDLSIVIEAPFVVIGDGGRDAVTERARTVRWAADLLERDFFAARPSRILDVYLFAGADSYQRGARALTGEEPGTPYGFYSSTNDALIMDISTGGGTLVHEIVHPYVEADFPGAPAWLNEGLGSLFEQSGERGGHIIGRTNWRLAGLQRGMSRRALPSFRELAEMTDTEFYAEEQGTNYAQARYLMYYLQEQGKLRAFYRAARAGRADDPTAYEALVATLGEKDMAAFQRRWERFVGGLRFP